MRKLLCNHKIFAQNYVIVFYLFFPFVWAKSLFIYVREREREREREAYMSSGFR